MFDYDPRDCDSRDDDRHGSIAQRMPRGARVSERAAGSVIDLRSFENWPPGPPTRFALRRARA